ncbi:hypothetical protein PGT21_001562 [Puccinia graminis f. sp. tritici]|uniref:Uncharacterized protein n=1 Tax=Puccinia graminis f. sp. tritici TaxID=56615 RepID=A0A5B0LKI8_PUCGR|nr:hypothetical protein PGT21_001562 [Puccinia graminis f. sp. tritici]
MEPTPNEQTHSAAPSLPAPYFQFLLDLVKSTPGILELVKSGPGMTEKWERLEMELEAYYAGPGKPINALKLSIVEAPLPESAMPLLDQLKRVHPDLENPEVELRNRVMLFGEDANRNALDKIERERLARSTSTHTTA